MRKSTRVECQSYSCEEHPETHDKFIGYIHNLMMGSKTTLLRKGIEDKTVIYVLCVYIYLFVEVFKNKTQEINKKLRQLHNTIKVFVYVNSE